MNQARLLTVVLVMAALVVVAIVAGFEDRQNSSLERGTGSNQQAGPQTKVWSDLGLGALVGALAGAVSTHLFRERAERARSERERDALLLLVYDEMWEMNTQLTSLGSDPARLKQDPEPLRRMDYGNTIPTRTWEEARIRLAQLLPWWLFINVRSYYRYAEGVKSLLQDYRATGNDATLERAFLSKGYADTWYEDLFATALDDHLEGRDFEMDPGRRMWDRFWDRAMRRSREYEEEDRFEP